MIEIAKDTIDFFDANPVFREVKFVCRFAKIINALRNAVGEKQLVRYLVHKDDSTFRFPYSVKYGPAQVQVVNGPLIQFWTGGSNGNGFLWVCPYTRVVNTQDWTYDRKMSTLIIPRLEIAYSLAKDENGGHVVGFKSGCIRKLPNRTFITPERMCGSDWVARDGVTELAREDLWETDVVPSMAAFGIVIKQMGMVDDLFEMIVDFAFNEDNHPLYKRHREINIS